MKTIILSLLVLAQASVFGDCFEFRGGGPSQIGPVRLAAQPTRVCVYRVSGFSGVHYSVRFYDAEGVLAQFASSTETNNRCPGFCYSYNLTSGNSNGSNVNPDNTRVEFRVERAQGTMAVTHRASNPMTYTITR